MAKTTKHATHTFQIQVYGEVEITATCPDDKRDGWEARAEKVAAAMLELHNCVNSAETEIEDFECSWTGLELEFEVESFDVYVNKDQLCPVVVAQQPRKARQ